MKRIAIILIIGMFIISGCQEKQDHTEAAPNDHNPLGDIREETGSIDQLPTFLTNYNEQIVDIYERSPHYQELLEHMPCYCGCGDSAGHTSNYDCFIFDQKEDGSLIWDDHGTRCNVCLEIAFYSMELSDQGASMQDIRQMIDERYKEGYAKPTDTPMPKA